MNDHPSRRARPFAGNSARTNRDNAGIPLPQLEQNQRISLARWNATRDGWIPEIITCRYQSHTPTAWNVTVDGSLATYSRLDWILCLP